MSVDGACRGRDVLVVKGGRGGGRGVLAALLLRGDDGLQVLALPPLLAAAAVRRLRDLLRLVDGGLLDVGAIHGAPSPPRAGCGRLLLGAGLRVAFRRSGRVGLRSSACGWECDQRGARGRRPALRFLQLLEIGLALPSPAYRWHGR